MPIIGKIPYMWDRTSGGEMSSAMLVLQAPLQEAMFIMQSGSTASAKIQLTTQGAVNPNVQ